MSHHPLAFSIAKASSVASPALLPLQSHICSVLPEHPRFLPVLTEQLCEQALEPSHGVCAIPTRGGVQHKLCNPKHPLKPQNTAKSQVLASPEPS